MYENSDDLLTKKLWENLESKPEFASELITEVVEDWEKLMAHTQPKFFAISQYASLYNSQKGFKASDLYAVQALELLKSKWELNLNNRKSQIALSSVGQNPNRWLVFEPQKDFMQSVSAQPNAISKLGQSVFISASARKLNANEIELVYLNRELLKELGIETSEPKLIEAFGLDLENIEPDLQGIKTKTVFIDKQADPLNIAMNGNLGSGRAAYVGDKFNLKGVGRTPLVQAPKNSVHGNGRLAFSGALWETVVSNSLYTDLQTSTAPVLVVFKYKNKKFPAPWGPGGDDSIQVDAGLIVRIDAGSLNRPSHLFQNPAAAQQINLFSLAARFAEQDAEKFIERVVHGAWSAGNISLEGHLLDMDTVTAVIGRHPQYSLTGKYNSNYFGLESIGQLQILKALSENNQINIGKIKFEDLEKHFEKSKTAQVQKRFLDLIGVDPRFNSKALYSHKPLIEKLALNFENLSKKMLPDFASISSWSKNIENQTGAQLFDFSSLFRHYPLLKHFYTKKSDRLVHAMSYLLNSKINFEVKDNTWIPNEIKDFLNQNFTVKNTIELELLKQKAQEFISDLDNLIDSLKESGLMQNLNDLIIRAYVINENRLYLTDSYGAPWVFQLIENENSYKTIDGFLNLLIQANSRTPRLAKDGKYKTDFRLFKEGYIVRNIDKNLNVTIEIHLSSVQINSNSDSLFSLILDNHMFELTSKIEEGELILTSSNIELSSLLKTRSEFKVLNDNTPLVFTDNTTSKPKVSFTLEVMP